MGTDNWTRRRLLGRAGVTAGLAAAGLAGCGSDPDPGLDDPGSGRPGRGARTGALGADPRIPPVYGVRHYVSRPDLRPPEIVVTAAGDQPSGPEYLFLNAPASGPGRGGAMIIDRRGELVWFSPNTPDRRTMNFRPQRYRGATVLTWWEGVISQGYGKGVAVIADPAYRRTHTVAAARGLHADLHEFMLTDQDTALVTAYRTTAADLSPAGGPRHGYALAGVAQEIDVATGGLVFAWDSLGHAGIGQTRLAYSGDGTPDRPFNYFHINSIAVAPDGDLLISARNTWTVYKVARPGGHVRWRLGGRNSSFTMETGARFYWQHDARPHGENVLSLFDNGAAPAEETRSRALLLDLDHDRGRARVRAQYVHPDRRLLAGAMGSAQLLPDGRVLVGWGTEPDFSLFAADGRLLDDGRIARNAPSYRVFAADWSGHPAGRPAVAARPGRHGGSTVYASWNGATAVRTWGVLAGRRASALSYAGSARRSGFETAITLTHDGPYFAVEARNARGHVLARSHPVHRHARPRS